MYSIFKRHFTDCPNCDHRNYVESSTKDGDEIECEECDQWFDADVHVELGKVKIEED